MSEDISFEFRDKEQEKIPQAELEVGQIVVCIQGHIDGFLFQDKTYRIEEIYYKYNSIEKVNRGFAVLESRDYPYLITRFRAATKREKIIYLKQQRDERHKR